MAASDYILYARAAGLPAKTVRRYMLRNALAPVVTLSGILFGFMLGGAVLVETVFSLDGLGVYALQRTLEVDFPAIQGAVVVMTAFSLLDLPADGRRLRIARPADPVQLMAQLETELEIDGRSGELATDEHLVARATMRQHFTSLLRDSTLLKIGLALVILAVILADDRPVHRAVRPGEDRPPTPTCRRAATTGSAPTPAASTCSRRVIAAPRIDVSIALAATRAVARDRAR